MATEMDDFFDSEPVVEPETETVETETTEPEEAEVVEEQTEEVTEEPTEVTEGEEDTTPPVVEEVKQVPLAAMLDERDKRKELQVENERLRSEQESKKEDVDIWSDPESFVNQKVQEATGQLEQKFTNGYISLSMAMSSKFHDDFDAARDAFVKASEANPVLAQTAMQDEMPGEYIYNTGKQFMTLEAAGGDVTSAIAQARLEGKAEALAEMAAKKSKLDDVPTPLTDETSAMAPREKVEGGIESLESILPN